MRGNRAIDVSVALVVTTEQELIVGRGNAVSVWARDRRRWRRRLLCHGGTRHQHRRRNETPQAICHSSHCFMSRCAASTRDTAGAAAPDIVAKFTRGGKSCRWIAHCSK